MKEQIISSVTAKLAKKIEFNNGSKFGYNENKDLIEASGYVFNKDLDENDSNLYFICEAPTQSLLQKWIRETHGIHIEITTFNSMYQAHIYEIKDKYNSSTGTGHYETYEDALEKGLYEALLLIKQTK